MSDTYTSILVHCVFSTKGRIATITADIRPKLWAYLGGIARTNKFRALQIGGTSDHVHALIAIAADMPVSNAVQLLKGGSSKWLHEHKVNVWWQAGYGAFTIAVSQQDATIKYIRNQEQHHRKRDFKEEFSEFLKAHGIVSELSQSDPNKD
jgi:putative transposase